MRFFASFLFFLKVWNMVIEIVETKSYIGRIKTDSSGSMI